MMNPFKVIKTESEYRSALAQFEEILKVPASERSYDDMELLSVLIEQYEDVHYHIDPPDPIEAIKFRMEQSGLSQKDLIPCLGSRSRVSEVLSGKRELTLTMIRALNTHLGIPAESLIREPQAPLPKALADLDFSKFPVKDMEKNGAFPGFNLGTAKISEKAEEAIRWLVGRAGGFSAVPQFALRKNDGMRLNAKLDNYALLGWSLQVLHEAAEHPASGHFNPEALTDKFIRTLVSLSVTDDGPRQACEYLNKAGIALFALPHLNHTYLDGAIFMAEGKRPIIALTLRYDRLDNYWFVLLHELGHLKLGHLSSEQAWIADDLELPAGDSKQELEADIFAAHMLLPADFVLATQQRITSSEVLRYASDHGVHPAIVAGRIQHTRKDFRTFANLLGHNEVRKYYPLEGRGWSKAIPKEKTLA
jgi:HTH-type transcriptional regulator/antitoxin HigA